MRDASEIHTCSYYCERPDCVRRQRDELRDALPPAADDPCVRHACKRVRMEMQAEVDRLRALLRRCYTERMTDELDEAIGTAIKGDSHAG